MKLLKHLFLLLGQNLLWQNDSSFKLRMSQINRNDLNNVFVQYDQVAQFFFLRNPEKFAEYDVAGETDKILKNGLINTPKMKLSFPVNM
jgi:hypothetical protein